MLSLKFKQAHHFHVLASWVSVGKIYANSKSSLKDWVIVTLECYPQRRQVRLLYSPRVQSPLCFPVSFSSNERYQFGWPLGISNQLSY